MPDGKTSHEKNVPRVFRVAVWSAAVFSAAALAFAFGLLAYNMIESPIFASTANQQIKCPAGTLQYAVNNYPGSVANPVKNHQEYYDKWGGDKNWRCSLLCIPVPDTDKPIINDENLSAARNYLKKCDFSIVANKQEFDRLSGATMLNTIILDSLKSTCQGPNSRDYEKKFYCQDDNGKENQPIVRRDTSYVPPTPTPKTPTPTKTPAKVQAPSKSGESLSAEGTQKTGSIITNKTGANATTDKRLISLIRKFDKCKKTLITLKVSPKTDIYKTPTYITEEYIDKFFSATDLKEYQSLINFWKPLQNLTSEKMSGLLNRCNSLINKLNQSPEHTVGEMYPGDQYKLTLASVPIPAKRQIVENINLRHILVHQAEGKKIYQRRKGSNTTERASLGSVCVAITDIKNDKVYVARSQITPGGDYKRFQVSPGITIVPNPDDRVILFAYDISNKGLSGGVRYFLYAPTFKEFSRKSWVIERYNSPDSDFSVSFTPSLLPYTAKDAGSPTGIASSESYGPYGELNRFIRNICQNRVVPNGGTQTFSLDDASLGFLAK